MHPKSRLTAKITGLITAALMLTHANASLAVTEIEALKKLNELVKAKQYTEAYDYANEHVMDFGGEAKFDYLMGLAAYHTQEYEQSVFAFERAVIGDPKWEQARFQLAKAYFRADNMAAAKIELIKLQRESTDEDFKAIIGKYITQVDEALIEKEHKFKQIVGISSGYDDNINSGTTVDSIFISQLGTDIPLSDESLETDDLVLNLSYQAQYQLPFTQKRKLIGAIGLYQTEYQDTSVFERTVADVSLKYQDEMGDFTYQVGAFFRPMILDRAHYRDQYGYATNWSLPLDANWSLGAQLGFGKIDSRINTSLDVRDVYGTFSARYRSGRWSHSASLNHTDIRSVEPDTKHNSYHFYQFNYQASYVVTPQQQATFETQWQKYNYDVLHPTFGKVRDEYFYRIGVGWHYIVNDWAMLSFNYRFSNKDSNVDIFEYERNEYLLGLTMQF
jgi:hypothetical protein